jgi:hypothetical protein
VLRGGQTPRIEAPVGPLSDCLNKHGDQGAQRSAGSMSSIPMRGITPSRPIMSVAGIGSSQASLSWAAETSTPAAAIIRSIQSCRATGRSAFGNWRPIETLHNAAEITITARAQ